MGGHLSGKPENPDTVLIKQLREIPLSEVQKVMAYFDEHYPETWRVTLTQYEALFSDILIKWEALGALLKDTQNYVDIYEAFSIFFTFCDGMFEPKVRELFSLFDFDGSGGIDFAELFLALQSTLNGVCKLLKFPVPTLEEVRGLAVKAFKIIDVDENDYIDFMEFFDWISNDEEIQEFMVLNIKYQTRAHALKIYHHHYEKYIRCFELATNTKESLMTPSEKTFKQEEEKKNDKSEPVASRSALKMHLMVNKDEWITEGEIDEILDIVDRNKDNNICLSPYKDAMRAMCSYMATDLSGDHVIQPAELRTLLWLTEGVEPTKERVNNEATAMDVDSSGTIEMIEWIKYLASVDPISGTPYFDFSLKRRFDFYDTDNSGSISKDEILNMLYDTYSDTMEDLREGMKETFKGLLKEASEKIMDQLDKDGSKVLEWNEFKQSMQLFAQQTEELNQTIKKAKASTY